MRTHYKSDMLNLSSKSTYQVGRIKDLHLSDLTAARIGEVAVVIVDGERTQTVAVRGRVTNRVEHFHITDVVNIEAFFKAHNQPLVVK